MTRFKAVANDWLAENALNDYDAIVRALRHEIEALVPEAEWVFDRRQHT